MAHPPEIKVPTTSALRIRTPHLEVKTDPRTVIHCLAVAPEAIVHPLYLSVDLTVDILVIADVSPRFPTF